MGWGNIPSLLFFVQEVMNRGVILLSLLALVLLPACGQDSPSVEEAPSVAQIEEEAGGTPTSTPVNTGVVPVTYEGEDKKYQDQAPAGMVYVKGGCFTQGTNNAQVDEKWEHEVCVDGFYMDKHEVTQKRWQEVMGYNPSKFKGENLPVEQVNYFDIQEFISRSNGQCRLPTEAEWEYAAGGGLVRTRYYWGNMMDGDFAWYEDNAQDKTHPVGQKKPNQYGLYDMMGNVWEWTEDWYAATYEPVKVSNPQGPSTGEYRVIRGGGMDTSAGGLRITNRTWLHPKNRVYTKITTYGGIINEIFNFIGFRCARDLNVKESGQPAGSGKTENPTPESSGS